MSDQRDFDEALRRWAGRPPATSAAEAARAVVDRSSVGQGSSLAVLAGRLSPARATLALAAVAVIAATASFMRSLPSVAVAPAPANPRTTVPERDADVVLWLDDGTPVYVFLPDSD